MKKFSAKHIVILMLTVVLFSFLLAGCNNYNVKIENHNWNFTIIQNIDENGQITHCSQELKDLYENAKICDISCLIENGAITISDNTENKIMVFSYDLQSYIPGKSAIYNLESENKNSAIASVGITEYKDGKNEYTLIVTVNEKIYYFKETII